MTNEVYGVIAKAIFSAKEKMDPHKEQEHDANIMINIDRGSVRSRHKGCLLYPLYL